MWPSHSPFTALRYPVQFGLGRILHGQCTLCHGGSPRAFGFGVFVVPGATRNAVIARDLDWLVDAGAIGDLSTNRRSEARLYLGRRWPRLRPFGRDAALRPGENVATVPFPD